MKTSRVAKVLGEKKAATGESRCQVIALRTIQSFTDRSQEMAVRPLRYKSALLARRFIGETEVDALVNARVPDFLLRV